MNRQRFFTLLVILTVITLKLHGQNATDQPYGTSFNCQLIATSETNPSVTATIFDDYNFTDPGGSGNTWNCGRHFLIASYPYDKIDLSFFFSSNPTYDFTPNQDIYVLKRNADHTFSIFTTNLNYNPQNYPYTFQPTDTGIYVVEYFDVNTLVTNSNINGPNPPIPHIFGRLAIIPKIEKLWIEASPVCNGFSDDTYSFKVKTDPPMPAILLSGDRYSANFTYGCEFVSYENYIDLTFITQQNPDGTSLLVNRYYNYSTDNASIPNEIPGYYYYPADDIEDYYIYKTSVDASPDDPVGVYGLDHYLPGGDRYGQTPTVSVHYSDGITGLDATAPIIIVGNGDNSSPAVPPLSIDNVDINTICAPGSSTPAVAPQFATTVSGGVLPYTYLWTANAGNQVQLDDIHSATPTITHAYGGGTAPEVSYTLTVTDASCSQQTATRVLKFPLTTAQTYDLAMRDSYHDMYDEPNTQGTVDPNEWNIWFPPDLWNRVNLDYGILHDDPQADGSGEINFDYMYIRNVGCLASPADATINTYWTVGGIGDEPWPSAWDGSMTYINQTTQMPYPQGGQITSQTLPVLKPGTGTEMHGIWTPPDPVQYFNTPDMQACFLSRIVDNHNPNANDGMTFEEGTGLSHNATYNNNIATRNMYVTHVSHKTKFTHILAANWSGAGHTYSIDFTSDHLYHAASAPDLKNYITVTVSLGSDLFGLWRDGGFRGTCTAVDTLNHTVTFDGTSSVRLDNITMPANAQYTLQLAFGLRAGADVKTFPKRGMVHARQLTDNNGQDSIVGAFSFPLVYDTSGGGNQRRVAGAANTAGVIKVYPNPATQTLYFSYPEADKADIRLTDISGRVISEQALGKGGSAAFDVRKYTPGMYFYQIVTDGNKQTGKVLIGNN